METATMNDMLFEINETIEIKAEREKVFEGLITFLTNLSTGVQGQSLPMKLELKPGGRWYRDLGNDTGHLWGFVQSIRPPDLLEIYGPMMLSFAVAGNLIIRLASNYGVTTVTLRHQIFGPTSEQHRKGMAEGWAMFLGDVKKHVE